MAEGGHAPPNVQINPGNDFMQYMQMNANFMTSLSNHFALEQVKSTIHHFNGSSAKSFRTWLKDLRRAALERQPVDDQLMRSLVLMTTSDTASDFYYEIRTARPDITWEAIEGEFLERFSNFVDSQLSLQKLTKLKQERKQTLHAFAQQIKETAREAYDRCDYVSPIVTRQLRDIFIDGLKCHRTAQLLIREQVDDLDEALERSVRQELLQQTYKLRQVDIIDPHGREIENMEVDLIEKSDEDPENPEINTKLDELTASVSAIAQNFKKMQGQVLKGQNNEKTAQNNKKTDSGNNREKTQRERPKFRGNNNNRGGNRMGRGNPPVAPQAQTPIVHPTQYPEFVPGRQYHNTTQYDMQYAEGNYPRANYQSGQINPTYSNYANEQYQNVDNNNHNYPYTQPYNSYNNQAINQQVPASRPKQYRTKLPFTPDGRPICLHCEKPGHIKKQCWSAHPELRPQNGPQRNQGPQTKN